jgi:RNA polymerase sigma factor (sigma-70 family)
VTPTRLRTVARRLAASPVPAGPPASDAELLTRFLDRHDEAAAGALVARHLPAVRAVCRSVLRDPHDADDAAQATFLVLVRRAATVRDRQAVGGWLCRVAWRTANRLRADNARRAARNEPGVEPDATPAAARGVPADDTRAALDEEIGRLPEPYRAAVLTCYAAGVPTAEAAARLGWPKGTLLTRLAWARKRLRDRLARRGVTLAGGFTGAFAGWVEVAASAALPGRVGESMTAVQAGGPPAGELVSDRVSFLTEGMVRHMIGTKIKLAVGAGVVAVAVLGLGLGRMTAGADPGDKKTGGIGPVIGSGTVAPVGAVKPKVEKPAKADEPAEDAEPKAEADGQGEELVRVRRPRGSYTKEVPPFGKGTITFADKRLHIAAAVHIQEATLNISLDADYSINPDGVVYGVITSAEVTANGAKGEEAATLGIYSGMVTDMPFAFRLRVEDDAISVRDIKFGPFGSPLLMEAFKNDAGKEMLMVMGMIGGKYKADPSLDRGRPLPAAPGGPAPRLRRP